MPRRVSYWEGTPAQYDLITQVQEAKREIIIEKGHGNPFKSDDYVMRNPVTGREVPKADLEYALHNLRRIYETGMIREDRWSFLWYN
jgi:hypothetical protein